MISASMPSRRRATAARISSALSTRSTITPYSPGGGACVPTSVTAAPRSRAASARAKPMRPLERLPT